MIKEKERRFELIKKVIQNQKMDLTSKIADLRTVINKKETAIKTFSNYLLDYQNKIITGRSLDTPSFINFQAFLNQIAKVLLKEQTELEALLNKEQELLTEYQRRKHQVDVIDDTLMH